MAQLRANARFAKKSLVGIGATTQLWMKEFDRNVAIESSISGLKDFAHAALSNEVAEGVSRTHKSSW
jgi:hypothetical protein